MTLTMEVPPEAETLALGYALVALGYLALLVGTLLASAYLPWPIEGTSRALLTTAATAKKQEEEDRIAAEKKAEEDTIEDVKDF